MFSLVKQNLKLCKPRNTNKKCNSQTDVGRSEGQTFLFVPSVLSCIFHCDISYFSFDYNVLIVQWLQKISETF